MAEMAFFAGNAIFKYTFTIITYAKECFVAIKYGVKILGGRIFHDTTFPQKNSVPSTDTSFSISYISFYFCSSFSD
jgi:hypothetical protein